MEQKVKQEKSTSVQSMAWLLIICMAIQTILPSYLYAKEVKSQVPFTKYNVAQESKLGDLNSNDPSTSLGDLNLEGKQKMNPIIPGGPDQPEVQSFTPIGTSDMVNPFTGDFSYNIPLMEVDGYPINIAYNAGVTMDQEATWVGLGWNLNPGVVNRSMRGIPDDFDGTDKITKSFNMKKDWTIGVGGGIGFELFGFGSNGTASLGASLGINYNNYNGFGADVSISPGISVAKKNKPELNFGLGLSGSSQGGATLSPSFSIEKESSSNGLLSKTTTTKGLSLGSSLNSRGGVGDISMKLSKKVTTTNTMFARMFLPNYNANSSSGGAVSASFNLGMSTYTPQISMPMNSFGMTFSFKMGPDAVGTDPSWDVKGYFNKRWLKEKEQSQSAFGYLNLQKGQSNKNAMMDFNRENDGAFTKKTPALPIPMLTYDIFSVSGQGVGGSYRAFRPDIGYVFDPKMANNSVNVSLGLEIATGLTFKGGIDISGTYSNSRSLAWETLNHTEVKFTNEIIPFREANEMSVNQDLNLYNAIGKSNPVRFKNNTFSSLKNILVDQSGNELNEISNYNRVNKEKRNQVIYTLSHLEVKQGFGIEPLHPDAYLGTATNPIDHHIAQFTTLNTDGTRYVYGIAAYNTKQKDVSFAIGSNASANSLPENCATGLVAYNAGNENSVDNNRGLDNYYNSVSTPSYAHSFLLTTVLNPDYIDADDIRGPSNGDLGGYIKFSYDKINDYKWRNPVQEAHASFDEGFNSDATDDKAHYTYGEKELWYVEKIETKNHVAFFYTSDRADAVAVNGEDGGLNGGKSMQKLDSIALYSLPEYLANPATAIPLKVVHFEYDYSLCQNYPQNIVSTGVSSGKLTLKKVYFTYQRSQKGRYSPYVFNYNFNPKYDLKSVDRWGNYKQRPAFCNGNVANNPLKPSDFPYVGFDQVTMNQNVAAWNLSSINLPSGGRIEVDYEADEYAFVQHKRAGQMLKIVGVQNGNGSIIESTGTVSLSNDDNKNEKIYFELIPGYNNIQDYIAGLDKVYFRALMKFDDEKHDFVPGYAEIDKNFPPYITQIGTTMVGCIQLKGQKLLDNGNADYNPIAVAGIQFGRLHLSRMLPPSNQTVDEGAGIADMGMAVLGAFASFGELFTGPNIPLWNDKTGTDLVIGKSWLRLNNPDHHKLGGGHRVKQIRMYDSWDEMTGNEMTEYFYGQNYTYNLVDGTSSGVASYEPQIGGDENPWRQPEANDTRMLLAPDTRNFQETPFGEQFFPSPSVGYSRVTIQDIPRTGVNRTATGKVVHEFYTAKDFPTLVGRTSPHVERFKLPVFAYFFTMSIDEMSASQGFTVETNDMHGKPKAQSVYAEDQNQPITKVEYFYQSQEIAFGPFSAKFLVNDVLTIEKSGSTSTNTVGLVYEAVADFRKSTSNSVSGTIQANINFTLPFIVAGSIIPSGSYERTAFRSATFTKVIERFGVLENTLATDLGSVVETRTLAYDAETGSAILTETATNFKDKVYSFTYPAHWYYESMGQAYINVDFEKTFANDALLNVVNGVSNQLSSNQGFFKGDEVGYTDNAGLNHLAWVVEATPTAIRMLDKLGNPVNASISMLKVLRSGRRNMQNTPIGSITLRTNPLTGLQSNIFENVLQAGSVEYSEDWNTFCECFLDNENSSYTTNPYVLGLKGTFRPKASFVHLAGRDQAFENTNSNIRNDGMFTSFLPFYRLQNGKWAIVKDNWTYTSSVVEFSPFGQALETVDALNRFSSSMFGYNQTLPVAVAANTMYKQLGADGFEDYNYDNCSDNHFKLVSTQEIVSTESHTGRRSVKVTANNPLIYETSIVSDCIDEPCQFKAAIGINPEDKGTIGANSTFTISMGVAPYQFEYTILQGSPTISFNATENGLILIGNGQSYSVDIKVTDANGCTYYEQISL
jgi:hypothetical protein